MAKAAAQALPVIEDEESGNRFVVYTTRSGSHLEVQFDGEQPWFTRRDMSTMFGVDPDTVGDHITKFRDDGELDESTTGVFPVVRTEGGRQVTRNVRHYSLDSPTCQLPFQIKALIHMTNFLTFACSAL